MGSERIKSLAIFSIRRWTLSVRRSTFSGTSAYYEHEHEHEQIVPHHCYGSHRHHGFRSRTIVGIWRDVLGFELSHTAHQTGAMAKEITGVAGAEIKLAVLKSPTGHKIEL